MEMSFQSKRFEYGSIEAANLRLQTSSLDLSELNEKFIERLESEL